MRSMDNPNEERLKRLFQQRKKSLENIEDFENSFVIFARSILRDVVKKVESQLPKNIDGLKIYYDDPYRYTDNRYLAIVTLDNYRPTVKNDDSTGLFSNVIHVGGGGRYNRRAFGPSIKFEGTEYNGEVSIFFNKYGYDSATYEKQKEVLVKDLDYDKTFGIIVDFFEYLFDEN